MLKSRTTSVRGMVVPFREVTVSDSQLIIIFVSFVPLQPDNSACGNNLVKKKCSDHAHKTEFWYLLGVLLNISNDHRNHLYEGVLSLGVVHVGILIRWSGSQCSLMLRWSLCCVLFLVQETLLHIAFRLDYQLPFRKRSRDPSDSKLSLLSINSSRSS